MNSYDIIGDIHGCNITLEQLLTDLGYNRGVDDVYCHEKRQVIFLGDFVDRGPGQREVIAIVQAMIASGSALTVMGNHEYNAIAFATLDPVTGDYLRPHSEKNIKQHQAFLDAYVDDQSAYTAAIDWFKTLPLWLDLGGIKVIHACWDKIEIEKIKEFQNGSTYLSDELLHASCQKTSWQYDAIETILKGKEITLPEGKGFHDKDGNARHEIRICWWDQNAKTYQDAFMGPEEARTHIPDDEINGDHLIGYSHDAPPVFLGHYWLQGEPEPLAKNIACTDYSVAKPGGKLVAYRWDGENVLQKEKFVSVERLEK
jgi:hypothetical protein